MKNQTESEKVSIFQQVDEAYRQSKVIVICLWPESRCIGPVYGFDRLQPLNKLMEMCDKLIAPIAEAGKN